VSDLLAGKRLLITGVITDASIAFSVAKVAQENGADVVLTGFGRMSLVERIAKRLPAPAPVIELDATNPEHLAGLADKVREHVDGLDGVVHSIAFGPQSVLGGEFLNAQWEDVGPFGEDDADYVFGGAAPAEPRSGLDLSPAAAAALGLAGRGRVSWRFVPEGQVPDGPWTRIETTRGEAG